MPSTRRRGINAGDSLHTQRQLYYTHQSLDMVSSNSEQSPALTNDLENHLTAIQGEFGSADSASRARRKSIRNWGDLGRGWLTILGVKDGMTGA